MSTRSPALIAGYEVGMLGVGCLWGLRRRRKIVLAGYHTLIAVGGSTDLMTAGAGYLTVSGCEDREVDIVGVAAEMVVPDRHMKRVVVHFVEDTVVLECENLSLLTRTRKLREVNRTWWSAVRTRSIVATRTLLGRWALRRIATIIAILWLTLTTILRL